MITKRDYITHVRMKISNYDNTRLWFACGILAAWIDRFCADNSSEEELNEQAIKCAETVKNNYDICEITSVEILRAHETIKKNIDIDYIRKIAPSGIRADEFFKSIVKLFKL
jgi:hypothetical protein